MSQKIVRNRFQIAACRTLVAKQAEFQIKQIWKTINSRKQNPHPTPDEQAHLDELNKTSKEYREEANRQAFAGQIHGPEVLCVG